MFSKTKKLLIISCSTGSGHLRAAESIRLTCQKLYPEIEVTHIDMANYLDWIAHIYVVWFYEFFSIHAPYAYKLVYQKTDNEFIKKIFNLLAPFIRLGSRRFIKKINDYGSDTIISTHFLPQLILPKQFSTPISVVVTDYYAHKIWLGPKIKNLFVATDEIKDSLEEISTKNETHFEGKIVVSGIPIHPGFFENKNVAELKIKLNIKNDWPVILMMPISFGSVVAKDAVKAIFANNTNINIVVITGKNNKKVFNDLIKISSIQNSQTNSGRLTVIKNTDNIDEWMRIADVIISKAGGLTISEVMHLQKPLIIINPIPGQEDYNATYLEKNHYALKATSSEDLAKKVQAVLLNPNIIAKKNHPNASEIILKTVFPENGIN